MAEASLLGAEVAEVAADEVRVVECVLLADELKVKAPLFEEEAVNDAELKVVFRCIAAPVPDALAILVTLMVEFPTRMVLEAVEAVVVALLALALAPLIEKSPVQLISLWP